MYYISFSRDDADVDIVEKGIQLVQEFNTVIVGDDTDLLVMMPEYRAAFGSGTGEGPEMSTSRPL